MQKRGSTIATPSTVPPQAVSDRSIIDSVAGFINDVTSSNTHQGDPLTQILWIRFENSADISDASLGQQFNSDLLIILGYINGIQVNNFKYLILLSYTIVLTGVGSTT